MLNLNDLQLFVQVVDHLGFAAASRALTMPKSTLAKRIGDFERELGVRLIQRTSRSFTVTEVGQDLYRHAAAMLIEAEAAEAMLKGRLAEPSGTVRLTSSILMAQMYLADILPAIAFAFPKLQIVLHATDRFVDLVQESFDIAIRIHYAPLLDSDLVSRRIGFSPNYLVSSPGYLEKHSLLRSPHDLAEHDGLLWSTAAKATAWSFSRVGDRPLSVKPRPRFTSDDPVTLLKAAVAGLGIASLPGKMCVEAIEQGRLVRVLPEWDVGGETTTILTPHRRGQLPSVRTVVEFLAERLSRTIID